MPFTSNVIEMELTGVGDEVIPLGKGYSKTQVEISERNSGVLSIKPKGFGGDVFADADPAISLDLATERTAGFLDAVDALQFTASVAGTYIVTVMQTLET